jgi:hypothetical protein
MPQPVFHPRRLPYGLKDFHFAAHLVDEACSVAEGQPELE